MEPASRYSSATSLAVVTNNGNRTTASQRITKKRATRESGEPQFMQLPSAAAYQPSRKKEEARALQNLRSRVQQLRIFNEDQRRPIEAQTEKSYESSLVNRPNLLKKILSNRPMSLVFDIAEIRTAWQDSDFITDTLCWHNVYRQRHNSPSITMSPELCHLAQTWANHLAHTNCFYYRNDKDIGQNLFCRPDSGLQSDLTGQEVASYWYSAVKQYDYGKEPEVLHANVNTGHFTQLIWAGSSKLGIGRARSRTGKVVVVAHYAPPGNITGLFRDNVLPPILEVSDSTDSDVTQTSSQSPST